VKPGSVLRALSGTVADVVGRTTDPEWHDLLLTALKVAPGAARLALPWLIKAREGTDASLLTVVQAHAERDPHGLAVEMRDERLSWSELAARAGDIAAVLTTLGVGRGDVVAVIGKNSPTYLALLLGCTQVGAIAALINWHLEGGPLEHAITASKARVAVVEHGFSAVVDERTALVESLRHIVGYGAPEPSDDDLEPRCRRAGPAPARVPTDASSDFVYIYTSGTTGLPKPCRVSHARVLLAGAGFGALMFRFEPGDKLYCVLPLYHSSALLIGVGGCVITRTPIALRETFSASAFWDDVARYRATSMLYIGELCRYLLNTDSNEAERHNSLRVAVGNGMRADVWEPFSRRFSIPSIREFYSATEAPGAIFNLNGKVGSIGHVPLRRLSKLKLARYDVTADEMERGADGFCVECGPEEVGQLVIRLEDQPGSALSDFRGYTDEAATKKKVAHGLFERGDRYYLSGDLLRFDRNDYFYFVDRIGDTYRWKGENVSTAEVAEVVGRAPGVNGATVSSVHVRGNEGRAGLAAVVTDESFDPAAFWQAAQELPSYAQPRFVRVMSALSTTGTFKIQKSQLRSEGVDPAAVTDQLFVRGDDGYRPLTPEIYADIVAQRVRL
jgi:fatty-acyl-CoA synthase